MFTRTIRTRLTFWYTLIVLSTIMAFGAGAYFFTRKTLSDNLDRSLTNEVRWVRDFIQPQAGKVKPSKRSIDALLRKRSTTFPADMEHAEADSIFEAADEIWNHIFKHSLVSPKKTYIQVQDRKGSIIYRSFSLGSDSLVIQDSLEAGTTELATIALNGEPIRTAAAKDPAFTIIVGYPLRDLGEVLGNLFSIFLVLIPIAIGTSVFGGLYLANKSLKPVDDITTHARRITAENLDQPIPVQTVNDEIGRLASTMNDMIRRLHNSFAQTKQFSADASHELRTPLTVLRGEIELALRSQKTPDEYRSLLESNLEEILRMTSIIENLLQLAKSDQGVYVANFEEVHLQEIVADLVDDCEALAEHKHISIHLAKNDPITLVGDKLRLRQLFLNLVDNAIKYTPDGGAITLSAWHDNGTALFIVQDTGIGIPSEEQGKIFDRFYRVDKARSREIGGAGLGLSIARWIAHLHRGSIAVHSEPGSGSTFTVTLPLS